MPNFQVTPKDGFLKAPAVVHRQVKGEPIFGVKREKAEKPNVANVEEQATKHTLTSLAVDFCFFTTGVLACSGKYERDIVREFARLHPAIVPEEDPWAIDYSDRFFKGFPARPEADYNRRIYAIAKKRWLLLRDFVASIAFIDEATEYYARINYYNTDLVDPFALKKQRVVTELPTVSLCVFGYSSTNSFSHILPASFPKLPYYEKLPPRADIFVERDRLFAKIRKST